MATVVDPFVHRVARNHGRGTLVDADEGREGGEREPEEGARRCLSEGYRRRVGGLGQGRGAGDGFGHVEPPGDCASPLAVSAMSWVSWLSDLRLPPAFPP